MTRKIKGITYSIAIHKNGIFKFNGTRYMGTGYMGMLLMTFQHNDLPLHNIVDIFHPEIFVQIVDTFEPEIFVQKVSDSSYRHDSDEFASIIFYTVLKKIICEEYGYGDLCTFALNFNMCKDEDVVKLLNYFRENFRDHSYTIKIKPVFIGEGLYHGFEQFVAQKHLSKMPTGFDKYGSYKKMDLDDWIKTGHPEFEQWKKSVTDSLQSLLLKGEFCIPGYDPISEPLKERCARYIREYIREKGNPNAKLQPGQQDIMVHNLVMKHFSWCKEAFVVSKREQDVVADEQAEEPIAKRTRLQLRSKDQFVQSLQQIETESF